MEYLIALIASLSFFTLIFIISLIRNDYSTVDVFWGLAQVFIGIILWVFYRPIELIHMILFVMISLWGFRLSLYLYLRNWHKPEDFRYVAMRKDWKGPYEKVHAFFKVFMLQGLFAFLMSFTFTSSIALEGSLNVYILIVGIVLFSVGFFFESVGDHQMRQFKKDPSNKGLLMTKGLWKYTRHPNYFGEVAVWWGIFITALSVQATTLQIILLGISPLTITYLLLYLSGIPMLEKKYEERDDFKHYKSKTSSFFPWFPKK